MSKKVKANGRIKLAPNHKSSLSSIIKARIKQVNVIEGDPVNKGDVLALIEGPAINQLQRKYLENKAELSYLEKEYKRKKQLHNKKVGSQKALQKSKAEYEKTLARLKGQKQDLKLLNIYTEVKNGKVVADAPIIAPFNGHIGKVSLSRGQFVDPHQPLLEILNTKKKHIELHVYEKHIHEIKKGQKISFTYANRPGPYKKGHIFRVGKKFHQDKQSIHVHAHIENSNNTELIQGMFINARIHVVKGRFKVLPEKAVVRSGDKSYVFVPLSELPARTHQKNRPEHGKKKKRFARIPVKTGVTENGFTSISAIDKNLSKNAKFVTKGAYSLQAEMKKGIGGHHH
ncbi:MAG: efflux RND transporter periplasmic adaptor subunit [Flavobacteriales bacterium]